MGMVYLLHASRILPRNKGGILLQKIAGNARPLHTTTFSKRSSCLVSRNINTNLGIIGGLQWPAMEGDNAKRTLASTTSDQLNYYADEDTLGLGLSSDEGQQLEHNMGQTDKIKISSLAAAEHVDEYYRGSESWATDEEYSLKQKWTPQLTKIVATIGPTSEQMDVLQQVVRCGMRIMRLNFSHATVEEVELRMKNIRACKGRHGLSEVLDDRFARGSHNLRAVLLDTRGPEIRTGKLRNDVSGKDTINLKVGDNI